MSARNASTSVDRRRQAGQRERHAADERLAVGLRLRRQPRLPQPGERGRRRSALPAPARFGTAGRRDRLERPVLLVRRPLLDPLPERLLLRGGELLVACPAAASPRPGRSDVMRAHTSLSFGSPGLIGDDALAARRTPPRARRAAASPCGPWRRTRGRRSRSSDRIGRTSRLNSMSSARAAPERPARTRKASIRFISRMPGENASGGWNFNRQVTPGEGWVQLDWRIRGWWALDLVLGKE